MSTITIKHHDDDIFNPAVAEIGAIMLSGKLGKPYAEIQKAIVSAHGAKMEMWASIFEFVIKTTKDEHKVEVGKICTEYSITVNQGTKTDFEVRVQRGLRIALGVPTFVSGKPKTDKKDATKDATHLVAPKSKISQYSPAFVYASLTGNCETKREFITFLNSGKKMNGTMKGLVDAVPSNGSNGSKSITALEQTVLETTAAELLKHSLNISTTNGAKAGTFKLIVDVDTNGNQTVMAAADLDAKALQNELKAAARAIKKDDLPKTTRDFIAESLKLVTSPHTVQLKYAKGKLSAVSTNKDGDKKTLSKAVESPPKNNTGG